ncbi:MAG: Gx transporter family protein [Peptostreptococcaceae bacterium]|nr:Gx transporter family protein [Peptostreptococcaceae bacterium]
MSRTKKMIFLSLMISYSLVLHLVERMLPSLYFIAPGAKLGLTNIISLVILYTYGMGSALTVLVLRIILSSIFGGGFSSFLYSITGGIFAIFAMWFVRSLRLPSVSEIGVSVVGAVFFNIGQLTAAALMIQNLSIFVYLPIMMYVSVVTGSLVGFSGKYIVQKLEKK